MRGVQLPVGIHRGGGRAGAPVRVRLCRRRRSWPAWAPGPGTHAALAVAGTRVPAPGGASGLSGAAHPGPEPDGRDILPLRGPRQLPLPLHRPEHADGAQEQPGLDPGVPAQRCPVGPRHRRARRPGARRELLKSAIFMPWPYPSPSPASSGGSCTSTSLRHAPGGHGECASSTGSARLFNPGRGCSKNP